MMKLVNAFEVPFMGDFVLFADNLLGFVVYMFVFSAALSGIIVLSERVLIPFYKRRFTRQGKIAAWAQGLLK